MEVHTQYGLKLVERNMYYTDDIKDYKVNKSCLCQNPKHKYFYLGIFISALKFSKYVLKDLIEEIESIISKKQDSTIFDVENFAFAFVANKITVITLGYKVNFIKIPTKDFKSIIEEFESFLNTEPIEGTIIYK